MQNAGAITESSYFYITGYKKHILSNPIRQKQKIKNSILYIVRILRISSNIIRANQRPSNLSGDQP
jgi:hypothetical protein